MLSFQQMVFKLLHQTYIIFGTHFFVLLVLPWIVIVPVVTWAQYAACTQSGEDKLSIGGHKTVSFMPTLSWKNIKNQLFQPTLNCWVLYNCTGY